MATALPPEGGAAKTLTDLGDEALREGDNLDPATNLEETRWAVGRLSDNGLERLGTFLMDLLQRAPLSSPAWAGHRLVIEALEADLQRERLARREQHGA